MTTKQVIAASLLLLAITGPVSTSVAQECFSGSEGRQLLEQGQVVPFPTAVRQAGISSDQVVDVQLCRSGGGYVYRVRILQADGQVVAMNIPAG
jgi:hypothetical protein